MAEIRLNPYIDNICTTIDKGVTIFLTFVKESVIIANGFGGQAGPGNKE